MSQNGKVSLNGKSSFSMQRASAARKTAQTILVVEDRPDLLKLVQKILEDADFTVLPANNAKEAMRIEAKFAGTIDLLLSDVMMPGMSGPDLAKELKEQRPEMRIILMSGYPEGALLVLNSGWHFIQKPFMPRALVASIKDVLQSKTPERAPISTRASGAAK